MNELFHTGVGHDDDPPGRGSGRYGWGTGDNPGQHQFNFISEVNALRKNGVKDAEIAKMLLGKKGTMKDGSPIWSNTSDLRAEISMERTRQRQARRSRALELYDKYNGNVSAVGREMGINESSVRSLLDQTIAERTNKYEDTANFLKKRVDEYGMIDVSKGTEYSMGVTDSTKKVALAMLEKEGYLTVKVQIPQLGSPDQKTQVRILAKPLPGETPKETFVRVQKNKYDFKSIQDYTPDQGKTWWTPEFPESMDSDRVLIRYAEDGGKEKDGVIEINPKAEDLSLEGSRYSQVRIAVDGTHYMKGMAIYTDEKLPKGIDVIYNTNKTKDVPKEEVFKKMKTIKLDDGTEVVDRENPFGALIKSPKDKDGVISRGGQHYYTDSDGKRKLSPINKLQDEGDWDSWSRNLASQFLSKQPLKLIKQQINLSVADKKADLDKINNLTNPVIKKKMLEDFAGKCDKNAADLSVKGFKNQAFQVILPIPSLKDNEIYAPNFKDGDTLALVRYPHGGTFEIPVLKVNNKNKNAQKIMKNASDAVGINHNVADRLSGADFDGDTALCIPMGSNRINIKSTKYLKDLEGFDPKEVYKLPEDAPHMKNRTKQNEMGRITNLITDMTVQGATERELSRAVKHSMVVIDAEKHHLDYKQSATDNDIKSLKDKYQKRIDEDTGRETTSASTIFSRAGSTVRINKRKEITDTKKMTPSELDRWNKGQIVWRDTDEKIVEKITDPKKMTPSELERYNAGKKIYRPTDKKKQVEVNRMDTVDDARKLVRDKSNQKEIAYAEYANELKNLANQARKESRAIKPTPVSKSATETYRNEVESLNRKLRIAQSNAPKERLAQAIANRDVSERFASNPDMDYEHRQRERARALTKARAQVGAKKEQVNITDREWEAIQANAISTNKLEQILNNTDQEAFAKRATPKASTKLSKPQMNLILTMYNSGMYTQKDIADRLGVSTSMVSSAIRNNRN